MDFNRSGRVETELHSDFRVQAYLCCDRAVQRGQDLINTLNQAAESYAHRLREGEGEGGREAKTGRREEGGQVGQGESWEWEVDGKRPSVVWKSVPLSTCVSPYHWDWRGFKTGANNNTTWTH